MSPTPIVSVSVREWLGRWIVTVTIGGQEFRRTADDEADAMRCAMEVQGFFESRLSVEFEPPTVFP